jgi:hypothetical protein
MKDSPATHLLLFHHHQRMKKHFFAPPGKNKKKTSLSFVRVCRDLAVSQFAESGNPDKQNNKVGGAQTEEWDFASESSQYRPQLFKRETEREARPYHNSCQRRFAMLPANWSKLAQKHPLDERDASLEYRILHMLFWSEHIYASGSPNCICIWVYKHLDRIILLLKQEAEKTCLDLTCTCRKRFIYIHHQHF